MNTEKILTGYPSIDKPWLKYYSDDDINSELPKCSVYDNIYYNNREFPDDTALMFFGKKISYNQLFTQVDNAAKAFVANGVKENENVVLLYACTS